MESEKPCPFCGETIRTKAIVCKHCHTNIVSALQEKEGKFVKVRVKTGDKVYHGEIFIPHYFHRVSDVINDNRPFLSLANTTEQTKASEINIGFLAVNKAVIEWVRLLEEKPKSDNEDQVSYEIYTSS